MPAAPSTPTEEEAWSRVLACWGDETAHHAYLARFANLEGLAVAGNRYRAVLLERPQDAMALRMRDQLVQKATVLGLATLPRTVRREQPAVVRRLLVILAVVLGAALVWAVYKLIVLLGAGS